MRRSENNGKVDVAMRVCRAWSAPAAPLSHIRTGRAAPTCALAPDKSSGSSGNDASNVTAEKPTLPHAVYRLFPTQTSFSVADIAYHAEEPHVNGTRTTQSAPFGAASMPSHGALTSELQAAKNQISLLTAASAQSFSSYVALESENAELKQSNEQLREENEALKERLAQRDDEINEQLHLICDLEKKLREFSSLTLTQKSLYNGQGHE
ncbi:hypothetical protein ABB37_07436 [Leptomonas pyrrhocoris]|uniref:Uncharacterized protein n=1 Tax=Leptomonas pyrrhocoris TaxID=157538 RepID=A0A0M9FVV1_LEPPY|nr:hypothetical protein ABB37_07436 [Leptomonas pyrrhocoris]XP_015655565.1 hypothetical protein ABB37_07436 [Leptomonas pyrrhocoris]KPA77125.1 hypothetical protein ABB37_07436 [Leptomonas pyrrhocoris]KPA77126.1 hypothetical protein ABB37_07436 [Leptomonas pyrrhocoris]|eukprot:XP_015655564.1 hypothetical protein ABB37_07436 [Leptomonas pyrrhocoris]